jgi:hypothetical protein
MMSRRSVASVIMWVAGMCGAVLLPGAPALAQTAAKAHVAVPVIPARPADVSSIEAIVRADYESISGGVGVARQWARDLTLYDANARSFEASTDPKTHAVTTWTPTAQEYTDATDAQFVKAGFSEHEVAHKIFRYGNIATVFSSYEGRLASSDKLESQGVNVYQLYFDGKRWWISSVSWDGNLDPSLIPADMRGH